MTKIWWRSKTGWVSTSPHAATASGWRARPENVALARDVLQDLYQRIQRGEEIDTGLVDASIAMAAEPTLDGIVSTERSAIPSIMIRTRKKTIVPRTRRRRITCAN